MKIQVGLEPAVYDVKGIALRLTLGRSIRRLTKSIFAGRRFGSAVPLCCPPLQP